MKTRGVLLRAGCVLPKNSTPKLFKNKNISRLIICFAGVLPKNAILYVCASEIQKPRVRSVIKIFSSTVAHQYFLEIKQGSCVLEKPSTR